MPIVYLPKGYTHCVSATYSIFPKETFFGYDIKVHNHAENAAGMRHSNVCNAWTCMHDRQTAVP